ncbi:aminoglycoside phosphotransferase family protein [Streptomyces sp. NPDC050504]|uniref:aminoglycoside phosphotransferase family protein n=1 Tax=Streptomyces sp. NPDC050504 TaxID=3365618 RepID=UPI00379FDAC6
MRDETAVDTGAAAAPGTDLPVEYGDYADVPTPWNRPAWRDALLSWAEQALTAHGLRETGGRTVRLRPWSVLVRMPVEGREPVWCKANPAASAFEAGLGEALARWVPDHVLRPIAVDAAHGWSLLPHGGELLADRLDTGEAGLDDWAEAMRQYALAQRALAPYADEIEALGVPGARTAQLPGLLDGLVESNTSLGDGDRKALDLLRPRILEWCQELDALGVPDTLDHSDLHENQILSPAPGRYTFFDWGDAAVAHPFTTMLVTARTARVRFGTEALPRLRDAYLEPWTADGRSPRELRRAVSLACRLGALNRARSWGRLFPEALSGSLAGAGDADVARWLRRLHDEPPL